MYLTEQVERRQLEAESQKQKGKQHIINPPVAGEQDPSPISGIQNLTLDSGGSSAANTPAGSPAAFPHMQLPEHPTLAPSPDPKPHDMSISLADTFSSQTPAVAPA